MKGCVSNKNESIRLFQNPVLEYFSHIHPATPLIVFVPVILIFAYLSVTHVAQATLLLWFSGVLFWTLLEYAMHRWAFHYEPSSKTGKRLHFLAHGVHHDYPRDATRLVMPLLVSVPLALFFYGLFKLVFQSYHEGLYAGFVTGYVIYDCLHYAFHHFSGKNRLFAWLKVYHLKHHYSDPQTGYGVSNPLWDFVFRTTPIAISEDKLAEWSKAA